MPRKRGRRQKPVDIELKVGRPKPDPNFICSSCRNGRHKLCFSLRCGCIHGGK